MESVDGLLDNWEDIADSGVLLPNLRPPTCTSEDCDDLNFSTVPVNSRMSAGQYFYNSSHSMRGQYGPPEPAVKILKRPSIDQQCRTGETTHINGDLQKPKQPVKTLQQREQAYAEARLRILGEARSPEENKTQVDNRIKIQSKMEANRSAGDPNVIRLPKGPDGTRGFNLRR